MSPFDFEEIPNEGIAPISAEDLPEPTPRARMAPAEALERLRRGETLENVRIDRLQFRGDFVQPVRMVNVHLCQPHFNGVHFAAAVSLLRCTIDRPKCHRPTVFADEFCLSGSTLSFVALRHVTVQGKFSCDNVICRGKFFAANCRFDGPVRFWEAHFRGWVEFKECEFHAEADFRSFHGFEGFLMTGCRCAGDVLFRGSTLFKKWDGQGTRFEKLLDFSKAKFKDFVYLESIEQGERQRFAFANALADRLLVRTEQIEDRLSSELTGNHDQTMHEYALLKRPSRRCTASTRRIGPTIASRSASAARRCVRGCGRGRASANSSIGCCWITAAAMGPIRIEPCGPAWSSSCCSA